MSHTTTHINTGGTTHQKIHTSLLGQLRDQTVKNDGTTIVSLVDSINTAMGTGTPSEMKARTDITDDTTDEFLLCDAAGHLQIDAVTLPSSSTVTTTGTTSAQFVQVAATLDGTNVRTLACDAAGQLKVEVGNITDIPVVLPEVSVVTADGTIQASMVQVAGNSDGTNVRTLACDDDGKLKVLNDKITQGYDAQVASGGDGLQQVVVYGLDNSGNLDALNVDNNGHLKIKQQDRDINRSSESITDDFSGTALSGSIGAGTATEYWDSENFDRFQFIIETTSSDILELQQSDTVTGSDFVTIKSVSGFDGQIVDQVDPAFGRYYRLLNSGTGIFAFTSIKVYYVR